MPTSSGRAAAEQRARSKLGGGLGHGRVSPTGRNSVFANELMTGYISGVPDPLSTVTVGALQDHGLHRELLRGGPLAPWASGWWTAAQAFRRVRIRAAPRSWPGKTASAQFDSADASVLMTNYDATIVSEMDGLRKPRPGERAGGVGERRVRQWRCERRGAATLYELPRIHAYGPAWRRHGQYPGGAAVLRHAAGPSDRLIVTGPGEGVPY